MARFDTYAKKTTPVADDTVLIYDSKNRNNKQLKVSDLGKYIVDNFSGSIRGTSITTGTDLNDLTTPGAYFCATSAIAGSLVNCPIGTNFTMLVMKKHTNLQTQVLFASTRILFRTRTSSGWETWYTMANMENDVEPLQEQLGALRYVEFLIDKNTTKTFSYPKSCQAKMIITSIVVNCMCEVMLASTGSGLINKVEIVKGDSTEIDYSVNTKLTITNKNTSYGMRVRFLIFTAGKTITMDEDSEPTVATTSEGGE